MNAYQSFTCAVSCKLPYLNAYETFDDEGILLLPESYSETGEATRLVISCHGAGGTVKGEKSQILGQTLAKYLQANGFALMDMAGLPKAYCERFDIDERNNIGAPIAVDSYVAGYRYCVSRYNLKPEVLVHGASMGGISSTNLVLSERVPTLVQTGFCPVLDTYHEIWLRPWSDGLPKTALEKIYSIPGGVYREELITPYNPMENEKLARYPIPVYFWQCADDETVSVRVTERFAAKVNERGGRVRLTVLPAGGHEPQLYGEKVPDPAGISVYRGEELFITEAVEGVYRVFREYR